MFTAKQTIQKETLLLLQEIIVHPFNGLRKPEPLKHQLKDKWSIPIYQVNEIIYEIRYSILHIHPLKGQYK